MTTSECADCGAVRFFRWDGGSHQCYRRFVVADPHVFDPFHYNAYGERNNA